MDGHAVRVVRTPGPGALPAPALLPSSAAPAVLPRQNRVSGTPVTLGPERPRAAVAGDFQRAADPRLLEARYEYPFPDDASLPCCVPPPPPPPRASRAAKELQQRGVQGVVAVAVDEYEDRDPNRINQHLQLLWEEVVAEPDGIRSPDVTWRGSARLFRLARDLVYSCLACFLGPPVAVVLGGGFAVIAFVYIWGVAPLLRAWRVTLGALSSLVRAVAHATVAPVTEALGFVFANVRVRVHGGGEPARQTASAASSAVLQPLLA